MSLGTSYRKLINQDLDPTGLSISQDDSCDLLLFISDIEIGCTRIAGYQRKIDGISLNGHIWRLKSIQSEFIKTAKISKSLVTYCNVLLGIYIYDLQQGSPAGPTCR